MKVTFCDPFHFHLNPVHHAICNISIRFLYKPREVNRQINVTANRKASTEIDNHQFDSRNCGRSVQFARPSNHSIKLAATRVQEAKLVFNTGD